MEALSGSINVMDDILVVTPTMQEHKDILVVVERATSYNLRLNFSKCHTRQSSVQYPTSKLDFLYLMLKLRC